jgi:predicted transposase/invertase (TIGR01784 family)
MRHAIDPKIDCVFKALLGAEANRDLLVHFLNAMLGGELPAPIVDVVILNPYNEREFLDDKLSIVDVKARDAAGCLYQIEIQLLTLPELPARILYGWADLYSAQLASGEDYLELKPTYAIWLLGETLLPDVPGYAHRYRFCDAQGRTLLDHGCVALFELPKFAAEQAAAEQQAAGQVEVASEEERWLKLFVEGEYLDPDNLPPWMNTPEMRRVMSTMQGFSEKERAYHAYQARQNYLRQQKTIQRRIDQLTAAIEREQAEKARARGDLERERAEKDQARAAEQRERAEKERERSEKERERTEKEAALAEIERLEARLKGAADD